jgi:D-alanyl-D-alanine carboxypeptidase
MMVSDWYMEGMKRAADEALPTASMSQMMTEFLVLEDVHSGK